MALTVAATTVTYLWASTYFIDSQIEPRRISRGISQKEAQLMYDTVGGWSSVSYFNRQAYEKRRYAAAVGPYLHLIKITNAAMLIEILSRPFQNVGAKSGFPLLLCLVRTGHGPRGWADYCRNPGRIPDCGWSS